MGFSGVQVAFPLWTDRHDLKNYLPATSLAGGKYTIESGRENEVIAEGGL